MKQNKVHVKIKDVEWTAYLLSDATYKRRMGSDSRALTDIERREIYFSKKYLDFETVVHEVIHALYESAMTVSADLTAAQVEEVFCELLGSHYFQIGMYANQIMKGFQHHEK